MEFDRGNVQAATTDVPRSSVAPRKLPFVFVRSERADVPGLVVEQRRTESGWEVLVASAHTGPDGTGALSVRWFAATRVRPATLADTPNTLTQ